MKFAFNNIVSNGTRILFDIFYRIQDKFLNGMCVSVIGIAIIKMLLMCDVDWDGSKISLNFFAFDYASLVLYCIVPISCLIFFGCLTSIINDFKEERVAQNLRLWLIWMVFLVTFDCIVSRKDTPWRAVSCAVVITGWGAAILFVLFLIGVMTFGKTDQREVAPRIDFIVPVQRDLCRRG